MTLKRAAFSLLYRIEEKESPVSFMTRQNKLSSIEHACTRSSLILEILRQIIFLVQLSYEISTSLLVKITGLYECCKAVLSIEFIVGIYKTRSHLQV
jgi:hypothetical protein